MLFYEKKIVIDDYGDTDIIIVDEDDNEVCDFEEGDELELLDMPFDRWDGHQFIHATGCAVYSERWGWQDEYAYPEEDED